MNGPNGPTTLNSPLADALRLSALRAFCDSQHAALILLEEQSAEARFVVVLNKRVFNFTNIGNLVIHVQYRECEAGC